MHKLATTLAAAAIITSGARAQSCNVVSGGVSCQMLAPQNDFTLRPLQGSAFYGDSDTNRAAVHHWIGQWGIPAQNPAFVQQSDGTWASGSNNATISLTKTSLGSYSLANSGGSVPCYNASTGVGEFDLFVNSMGSDGQSSGYGLGMIPNWSAGRSQSLSAMTNLNVSFGLAGHWLGSAGHSGGYCSDQGSIDQYNVLAAFTLIDTTSGQAMFYQASLGTGAVSGNVIRDTVSTPQYFETNNAGVWGFDDPATQTIGQHIPFDDTFHQYLFDALPRIKYAIANDPTGKLDKNLSHWVVSGFYNGNCVWGDLVVNTGWQNLTISGVYSQ